MLAHLLLAVVTALASQMTLIEAAPPASNTIIFSSSFTQPAPPMIRPAFTANFNQHKWNKDLSHIASGFWYSSPSVKKVRIDEAYESTLASSLFDYNNVTSAGVNNILWSLTPSIASQPQYYVGYQSLPSFPLFVEDLLVASNAIYAGTTVDPDFGQLMLWNIVYEDVIPATLRVDAEGVIHGFDYWSPHDRTFVITRLFNIVAKEPQAEMFEFPDPYD